MFLNPIQVGNEGKGADAKDFLYVDAFNGGKAMSCAEVMALVKRLVGNDVTLSDECMLAVPTLRQVHSSWISLHTEGYHDISNYDRVTIGLEIDLIFRAPS